MCVRLSQVTSRQNYDLIPELSPDHDRRGPNCRYIKSLHGKTVAPTVALANRPKVPTSGCLEVIESNGGDDGARTRDLRPDRPKLDRRPAPNSFEFNGLRKSFVGHFRVATVRHRRLMAVLAFSGGTDI